ncbi:ShlB/FhaC/HecB family hemolysin secretion/activation protein [Rhodomicrobium sp.]|uniref:ShlB/FhaC/HecB family hemolysin secretion/activation protein n=1 Tax=Rhodomicrobium sp. TaxID=2720632 RepID=UPI0039E2A5A7
MTAPRISGHQSLGFALGKSRASYSVLASLQHTNDHAARDSAAACLPRLSESSFVALLLGSVVLFSSSAVLAQTPPSYNAGDAARQAEEARRAEPLPKAAPRPVIPGLGQEEFTLSGGGTLVVKRLAVHGADALDAGELAAILKPFEGRRLTLGQIYEAAAKVTAALREKGYMLAKAYVPKQDARGGTLRIEVVTGHLGGLAVKNVSLVDDWLVKSVIDANLAPGDAVKKADLERSMLLLSDTPGAGLPKVTIEPGRAAGTSDLAFAVPEARLIDGYVMGDNLGGPYTGRYRASGGLNVNSPFGLGDKLSVFGMVSDTTGILNGRVAYNAPIGFDGLRGEVFAYRTTYELGGVYDTLDATGTADAIGGSLAYAVKRSREDSIWTTATYTHKELHDEVWGATTSTRRMDLGTAAVQRDQLSSLFGLPLATSLQASGTGGFLDIPNAVELAQNRAGVDTNGTFWKIAGSAQATVALLDDVSFSVFARGQKAMSGNLDSSEQFSLSGQTGVRSFDEGLSVDTGYVVTPELKYAIPLTFEGYRHSVGLFTDVAGGWIEDASYTTLPKFSGLKDVGLSYNSTYEYLPGRYVIGRGIVAWSYGATGGAEKYDDSFKALFQAGVLF